MKKWESRMTVSKEVWKQLVEVLYTLDDNILGDIEFEIWCIRMERRAMQESLDFLKELRENGVKTGNVVSFRKKEDD